MTWRRDEGVTRGRGRGEITAKGFATTDKGLSAIVKGRASIVKGFGTTDKGLTATVKGRASIMKVFGTTEKGFTTIVKGCAGTVKGFTHADDGTELDFDGTESTAQGMGSSAVGRESGSKVRPRVIHRVPDVPGQAESLSHRSVLPLKTAVARHGYCCTG